MSSQRYDRMDVRSSGPDGANIRDCGVSFGARLTDGSGRRKVDQLEAFFPCCLGETVVERDDLKRWRTSFGRNESRRKLQCVRRPERMNAKKPERVLANDLARFDLVPPVSQLFQPIEGRGGPFQIKQSVSLEASERRSAFHLRSPPHQAGPNLDWPAPAGIALCSPPRAAAQSPKHPRTSPPLPALVDEYANGRRSGAGGRRGENSRRRDSPARPQHAVSNEPRQSSAWAAFLAAGDRLQTRDRTAPINNQNRLAALETVDQSAQAILSLGNTGSFHIAKIALTTCQSSPSRPIVDVASPLSRPRPSSSAKSARERGLPSAARRLS